MAPQMKPWYLVTVPELHRLMFNKVRHGSLDLITRKNFISIFNALPNRTRNMYIRKSLAAIEEQGVSMDLCTGLKCNAATHNPKRMKDIKKAKTFTVRDGELALNAVFNHADSEQMAVIPEYKFGTMLDKLSMDETVEIAKGLGVDVPIAHVDIVVGTYNSSVPDGVVDLDDKTITGAKSTPKSKSTLKAKPTQKKASKAKVATIKGPLRKTVSPGDSQKKGAKNAPKKASKEKIQKKSTNKKSNPKSHAPQKKKANPKSAKKANKVSKLPKQAPNGSQILGRTRPRWGTSNVSATNSVKPKSPSEPI